MCRGKNDAYKPSNARSLTEGTFPTRLWLATAVMGLRDGRQPIPNKQECVPMSEEAVHGPEAVNPPAVMSLAKQATVWYTRKHQAVT